jgi:hypothetical protein
MRWFAACLLLSVIQAQPQLDFLNHNRSVLDAHNCYPERGQWPDRIARALKTGYPVAIEQDLAWFGGRAVLSHTEKTTGVEPTLRAHFFERVRPIVEKALAANDRAHWPLIVLHFDFKSFQPELLREVWKLLGEYEPWLTTAIKTRDPRHLSPFDPKPLLVLTEDHDVQEEVFFRDVPVAGRLRLFGSAQRYNFQASTEQERWHLQATARPEELLSGPPTNYRRWWNNSWYVVEEAGQERAGAWTQRDEQRLRSLVEHAHKLGYWIRFYTLDGFLPAENRGWTASYNFGSRAAVEARWKAAIDAGVDLIATDQYEELAEFMRPRIK